MTKLHCPIVVDATERRMKGIVCQKPMTMTLEEADRMLTACRLSGTQLTISHQRYYTPQYAQARELLSSGAVGTVCSAEAYLLPGCIHTDGTHTWMRKQRRATRVRYGLDGDSMS